MSNWIVNDFGSMQTPILGPSFMKSPNLVLCMLSYVVVTFVEYNNML